MIAGQVQVELNKDQIKAYIKEQLDQQIRQEYLFVDINKLVEITSCSKRWLEDELLTDPRIRLCERRKNRKRLWLFPDVVHAIREVSDGW